MKFSQAHFQSVKEFWQSEKKRLGMQLSKLPADSIDHWVCSCFYCKADDICRRIIEMEGYLLMDFPFQRELARQILCEFKIPCPPPEPVFVPFIPKPKKEVVMPEKEIELIFQVDKIQPTSNVPFCEPTAGQLIRGKLHHFFHSFKLIHDFINWHKVTDGGVTSWWFGWWWFLGRKQIRWAPYGYKKFLKI
jgi:hypothetical protein